jgi:hypothetical protein
MHFKLTCCCIASFFAILGPASIAQNPVISGVDARNKQEASAQTNDKFSTALESQLLCKQAPEPARAIGALQRAGIVERRSYINIDSMNYFRVRQPLTVWGLKVVSVLGFDFNPRIFERGPGTAPYITLGVVVPISEANVKAKLLSLGVSFEHIGVQRAEDLDFDSKRAKASVRTEISCTER